MTDFNNIERACDYEDGVAEVTRRGGVIEYAVRVPIFDHHGAIDGYHIEMFPTRAQAEFFRGAQGELE